MPRKSGTAAAATRRVASQAKAADEGVRLPADVYNDLMRRAKKCNVLEKYTSALEASLKIKDQIIAQHDGDWQFVNSKLDTMIGDMRNHMESIMSMKESEEDSKAKDVDNSEDMQVCDGSDVIVIDRSVDIRESVSNIT